jgi:hypothetical protein
MVATVRWMVDLLRLSGHIRKGQCGLVRRLAITRAGKPEGGAKEPNRRPQANRKDRGPSCRGILMQGNADDARTGFFSAQIHPGMLCPVGRDKPHQYD